MTTAIQTVASRLRAAVNLVMKGSTHPFITNLDSSGGQVRMTSAYNQSPWVRRAIKKVASPISAVPLKFYAGDQEHADPALAAFWERPVSGMTRQEFVLAAVGWLKLRGEVFLVLDDSYLVPFPEARRAWAPIVMPRPQDMAEVVERGRLVGWRYQTTERSVVLLPEQVVQVRDWNPDNALRGSADAGPANLAAEAEYLAGTYVRNLMSNQGDQGSYIIAKNGLPDDAQRAQVIAQLREKRNAQQRGEFRPLFLAGDFDIQDPKLVLPEASFVQLRTQNRFEIFLALGVPPSMADKMESYSVGSASDWYLLITETCIPAAAQIAAAIARVAKAQTGLELTAEFDWDEHPVLQSVRRERLDAADKLWAKGMPMQEINDYLDLGISEYDGWDVGYLPFSVAPVGTEQPEPEPARNPAFSEPPPGAPEEPVQEMLRALQLRSADPHARRPARELALWRTHMASRRDAIRRFEQKFRRVLMAARAETLANLEAAARKSATPAPDKRAAAALLTFNLSKFAQALWVQMRGAHEAALQSAGDQLYQEVGLDDPWKMPDARALEFMRNRENRMKDVAENTWETVKERISSGMESGDSIAQIADSVRSTFNDMSSTRARAVAMTETAAAYGTARQEAMVEAGIESKEWLTSGNDNVRPAHQLANHQVVPVNEPFIVDGEQLQHPGDPAGSPGNVINCHCVSIPTTNEE
jgi:phage portal protein BeeE/uncharacterized protein YoaH (UPF0181 family)